MSTDSLPLLFQPLQLRGLALANRVVISPMCQHAAERGHATPWHMVHLGKFALGDLTHAELMRSIDLFASDVMDR